LKFRIFLVIRIWGLVIYDFVRHLFGVNLQKYKVWGLDIVDEKGTLCPVMLKALTIIEFVFSALIIASVLLQQRSTGLGGAFASDSNVFRSKRGIEKFLYNATIASAVVLVVAILTHLYLRLHLAV